jgi:hypothetical protein
MAHYENFVWEKHDGLWRFYNPIRRIYFKRTERYAVNQKNLDAGKVHIDPKLGIIQSEYTVKSTKDFPQEWYEQDHWAWEEKTGNVYRIRMKDGAQVERKLCGQVSERRHVVLYLIDRDITSRDEYSNQDVHKHLKKEDWKQVKWCRDYDNRSILVLCQLKPKMTFAEIKNVIENEGGSVDSMGIIHRD